MSIRPLAIALALCSAALPLTALAAINIHFEIANQRGEVVTVEPASCAGFGKTQLAAGKTLAVDCKIEVGGQTAPQVRTLNGAGVICGPHAAAISEYRIEAGNLGTSSCSFDRVGGTSYRIALAGAKYFTIHLKNQLSHDIKVTMANSNCAGNIGWNEHRIPKGGGIDFRCFREGLTQGEGVMIQVRMPNNTRDMICHAWWHGNKTFLFNGHCAINQVGPDDYDFLVR